MSDTPYLHIYAQGGPHDEVRIAGTPAALSKLRDALDVSLQHRKAAPCQLVRNVATTLDGEWFDVIIELHETAEQMRAECPELPYTGGTER